MSPIPTKESIIFHETDDDDEVCDHIVDTIDSFLQNENNISIWRENMLFPQISLPQIQNAKMKIIKFFENNLQSICFGTSSGGYTGHYLFKKNNKIYVVYMRTFGNHYAHNFTTTFLERLFIDYPSDKSIILNSIPNYYD